MDEELYEELSEEDIAKMLAPPSIVYYVYFNDDGVIDAITNEKRLTSSLSVAEVEMKSVENFLNGKHNYINYRIVLAGKQYAFVENKADIDVGLNTLSAISNLATDTTSCVVKWDKQSKQWTFYLQEHAKMLNLSAMVSFFIALSSNKNFLVRTIKFDIKDLEDAGTVSVPFISQAEEDITNIRISTKKFFDSYGLLINE